MNLYEEGSSLNSTMLGPLGESLQLAGLSEGCLAPMPISSYSTQCWKESYEACIESRVPPLPGTRVQNIWTQKRGISQGLESTLLWFDRTQPPHRHRQAIWWPKYKSLVLSVFQNLPYIKPASRQKREFLWLKSEFPTLLPSTSFEFTTISVTSSLALHIPSLYLQKACLQFPSSQSQTCLCGYSCLSEKDSKDPLGLSHKPFTRIW